MKAWLASAVLVSSLCIASTLMERLELARDLSGAVGDNFVQLQLDVDGGDRAFGVNFTARFYNATSQAVMVFFANEERNITQIRMEPNGASTVVQYWAPHNVLTMSELKTPFVSDVRGSFWSGTLRVGLDLLPSHTTRYNAVATHGIGDNKTEYLCYYSVTNYPISIPDLMVLDKYKVIGSKF